MRRRAAVAALALAAAMTGVMGAPVSGQAAPVVATADATAERVPSRRLVVPSLGVDAGIIPVGVNRAGQLDVGTSVRSVYRWRNGVVAGQPGSAVLAGHTWSRGDGVFDRLGSLSAGDRVSVGEVRFQVTRVRRVTRMAPKEVRGLFSDRGRARLVLITCGNRNNTTGVYRTRIIVNATKV